MIFASLITAAFAFAAPAKIDSEAIRQVITKKLQVVNTCYEDALDKEPSLTGKVVIDFTIDDRGKVIEAKANKEKSDLKSSGVEHCIANRFKEWSFPPAAKGETIKVNFPFFFSKSPNSKPE